LGAAAGFFLRCVVPLCLQSIERTGSLPREGRAALGAIARARGVNCKIVCGIELVRSILIEALPLKGCTDCTPNRVALDTLP
jgi:hypothetical protein